MRNVLSVVAGLVTWLAIAFCCGLVVRESWPAYVAVMDEMKFTLPMMFTRLGIGVVATVGMGFIAAKITQSRIAALIPGIILLILFIPEHISLWDKFPIWYHLWFLSTLVPLTYVGNLLARRREGQSSAPSMQSGVVS